MNRSQVECFQPQAEGGLTYSFGPLRAQSRTMPQMKTEGRSILLGNLKSAMVQFFNGRTFKAYALTWDT